MKWTPQPHHRDGLDWLLSHEDAALWFEMGLGKTAITLTAISKLILEGASRGALIVAPIRVCAISWPDQVERWDHLRWLRVANLRTPEGVEAWDRGSADIYLINPEMLPSTERTIKGRTHRTKGIVERLIKGRKELPVDIFVLDESTLAKNPSSKRFKAIRPFLHDIVQADGTVKFRSPFRRRWGLTGTPAPNSYLDLFGQVLLMDSGKRLGRSITAYKQRFFESDFMGWKWTIRDGAKEKIDALLSDFALVKLGADHLDVPPCTTEDVDVKLPASAKKAYKTLEKEMLVQLKTGEIEALSAAALTTKLLQITAGCVFDAERDTHVVHDAKINALRKIRKRHKGEPLLVVTEFTHERKRLLEAFPEATMFDEKRMADWRAGKIPMWITDRRAISHGVDSLQTSCKTLVWLTPTYSFEGYAQMNARLVRTGQKHETTIYRVLAENTIDWAVVEALKAKREGQDGLMQAVKNLQRLRENQ